MFSSKALTEIIYRLDPWIGWVRKGLIWLDWSGPQVLEPGLQIESSTQDPNCQVFSKTCKNFQGRVEHGHWLEGLHGTGHPCLGLRWGGEGYMSLLLILQFFLNCSSYRIGKKGHPLSINISNTDPLSQCKKVPEIRLNCSNPNEHSHDCWADASFPYYPDPLYQVILTFQSIWYFAPWC